MADQNLGLFEVTQLTSQQSPGATPEAKPSRTFNVMFGYAGPGLEMLRERPIIMLQAVPESQQALANALTLGKRLSIILRD